MNDNIANLILEKVNRIDDRVAAVEGRLGGIETDLKTIKDAVRRIDGRQAAMDHYMAGFNAEQRWQNEEMEDLKRRLDNLERPAGPQS
jgi:chromosome segregation ATPase